MLSLSTRFLRVARIVAAVTLLVAPSAFAQAGRIEGTVRDALTSNPLPGARVSIVGTTLSAMTGANGAYAIDNAPIGGVLLRVQLLGYQPASASVQVSAGTPAAVNFTLHQAVINLSEIIVTGVVGETERAKLPINVDRVTDEDLPVPEANPLSALQGKVAGAMVMTGSGRPGSQPSILLRGPTSIDASGRTQEPLYVVDGVILGSGVVDLDALDIEAIEVVKGAAAASLYGSRAQNGVVQITTRRGSRLPEEIHFTVRSEGGTNRLPSKFDLAQHHAFQLDGTGQLFVRPNGSTCNWLECASAPALAGQTAGAGAHNQWNSFMNLPWPGQTYDQVARFFEGGNSARQYVAAEGRSGSTNFHASWSNDRQEGIMLGQKGYWRNNLRMNLDQWVGTTFKVSASTFYSKAKEDARSGDLFGLTRMPAGVDLLALNHCPAVGTCAAWQQPRLLPNGQQDPHDVYLNPDPFNNESPNPIYTSLNGSDFNYRGRFLASADARWQPVSLLAISANVSYDRLDFKEERYTFKGYKTITPSPTTNNGNLFRSNELTENINASVDATISHRFGDLATRTQFRYLAEFDNYDFTRATGRQFTVGGVPTIDNTDPALTTATSGLTKIRADGYFGITNFDYKDRYIVDALVRNDGSSLFGPDARRHWYYRVAGAWRATQDFQIPHVDELKLRAAYGTAGGRPRFEAQYETYTVNNGQISPVTLGNRNLKPEYSKELELGIDMLALGRIGLTANYATTTTEDQILQVPVTAFRGFQSQWQNAGTLKSTSWEASLDVQLARTRAVSWSARVLFDRTRQHISKLTVPPFTYGDFGGNSQAVFYAREGEEIGSYYGVKYATSCADLLGALPCDQFAVNSDGLLVWVGPGGSLSNPQWGTTGPTFGFKGQNRTLMWGSPVVGWGLDPFSGDTTKLLKVGKTNPDFHMGFSTTLGWHNVTVYGLLEWVKGISVYNVPQQWAVFRSYAGIMDQTGAPAGEEKPLGYYNQLYGIAGLSPVNFFVQDGSFAKLREVSLQYRFDREQLAHIGFLRNFNGIAVSVIGRNLLTFTDYNGYDPEVGFNGGDTGSAAIARVDGYQYPNFRNFSFSITINY